MHSSPIFTIDLNQQLQKAIEKLQASSIVLVCDENTREYCLPLLDSTLFNQIICIAPGEESKTFKTYQSICEQLIQLSMDKNGLLLALGGGVISDLTGFIAATYKRGIKYINIPTSLLAMVDASIGGKTGINAGGIKNSIGAIYFPEQVISTSAFLNTLPKLELNSGFGEVVKHCFIKGFSLPAFDSSINNQQLEQWSKVKYDIVRNDPFEKNERFVLNAGHTVGHALESYAMENNIEVQHGNAVVQGLLIESILAADLIENAVNLSTYRKQLLRAFGKIEFTENDIPSILQKMGNDKKNKNQEIQCSFIQNGGQWAMKSVTPEEISNALKEYVSW